MIVDVTSISVSSTGQNKIKISFENDEFNQLIDKILESGLIINSKGPDGTQNEMKINLSRAENGVILSL